MSKLLASSVKGYMLCAQMAGLAFLAAMVYLATRLTFLTLKESLSHSGLKETDQPLNKCLTIKERNPLSGGRKKVVQ